MKDGKYVVLYVDDDQDMLDNLQLVLEANGYIMVTAPTAEEGLKAYKAEKPDLVIIDLMMEEVDAGTQLVKSLQAEGNKAPVYILSSVGETMLTTMNFAELGLTGIFQKPIDFNTLLLILKTKLG